MKPLTKQCLNVFAAVFATPCFAFAMGEKSENSKNPTSLQDRIVESQCLCEPKEEVQLPRFY